jgi:hypothetical protein
MWRTKCFDLFRDIVILMRETGMRNERELYRVRIEEYRLDEQIDFHPGQQNPERQTQGSNE